RDPVIFVCGFMPSMTRVSSELIRQQSEKLKFARLDDQQKSAAASIRRDLNVDRRNACKLSQIRDPTGCRRNLAVRVRRGRRRYGRETGIRITAEENLLEDGGRPDREPDDVIPAGDGTQDEKSTARSSHHADRTRSRSRTAGRRNGDSMKRSQHLPA
ncbi:hypothetical protein BV898_16886, partial [Hypsibius exemplaris]